MKEAYDGPGLWVELSNPRCVSCDEQLHRDHQIQLPTLRDGCKSESCQGTGGRWWKVRSLIGRLGRKIWARGRMRDAALWWCLEGESVEEDASGRRGHGFPRDGTPMRVCGETCPAGRWSRDVGVGVEESNGLERKRVTLIWEEDAGQHILWGRMGG